MLQFSKKIRQPLWTNSVMKIFNRVPSGAETFGSRLVVYLTRKQELFTFTV